MLKRTCMSSLAERADGPTDLLDACSNVALWPLVTKTVGVRRRNAYSFAPTIISMRVTTCGAASL